MKNEKLIATVDVAVLTLKNDALRVALFARADAANKGSFGLAGGPVKTAEDADLDAAARRILREQGVLKGAYVEQLSTFSGIKRDPRGWSISASYLALLPAEKLGDVKLSAVDPLPRKLPFDHGAIIRAAAARVRQKSVYSSLPSFMMPDEFTIAELRDVYQTVLGNANIDLAGFRKKILDLEAIEPVEGRMRTGTHRPAQLYRRASKDVALFNRTI